MGTIEKGRGQAVESLIKSTLHMNAWNRRTGKGIRGQGGQNEYFITVYFGSGF